MSHPLRTLVVMSDPQTLQDESRDLLTHAAADVVSVAADNADPQADFSAVVEPSLWASIAAPCVETAAIGVDLLSMVPWNDFTPDDRLAAVEALIPLRNRIDSMVASALAAVDSSDVTFQNHGLRTKDWISQTSGDAPSTISRSMRLGKTLDAFPTFDAAIHKGKISLDHAHVLTSAVTPRLLEFLQERELELIDMAMSTTVEQWRKDLRALIDAADTNSADPAPKLRENRASITFDETGRLKINGSFYGPDALTMFNTINDEFRRQFRDATDEQEAINTPIPPSPILHGRAFTELFRRGASPDSGRKPTTEAILVLDPRSPLHPIRTLDGDDIDPVTAATLFCGCDLHALQLNSNGNPLKYGRVRRTASKEQNNALAIRDGGCIFPGCSRQPDWCDAHHIKTWAQDHGLTDIENLALLCRKHHTYLHKGTWELSVDELELMWWRDCATGRRFLAQNAETRHNWTAPSGKITSEQLLGIPELPVDDGPPARDGQIHADSKSDERHQTFAKFFGEPAKDRDPPDTQRSQDWSQLFNSS